MERATHCVELSGSTAVVALLQVPLMPSEPIQAFHMLPGKDPFSHP